MADFEPLRTFLSQPVVASFVAGGVAGAFSRTVVSPLERMKIIYQVQDHTRTEYKMSMTRVIAKIWEEEKWKGYWRGNGINCIRVVPYSVVQFSSYKFYKVLCLKHGASNSYRELLAYERLTIGGLASVTSVFCTYPLDLVRTRLTIQTTSFEGLKQKTPLGIWFTLINVYRFEDGVRGLYRGVLPTIAGVAPYVGVNFWNYERFRKHVVSEGSVDPSAVGKLGSSAMSGAVAQFITYPFDVIRRRCQVSTMPGMSPGYSSVRDVVRGIWRFEGIPGFFKGSLTSVLKIPSSMASSWIFFELTRDLLLGLRMNTD